MSSCIAPGYLTDLFKMRESNSNSTLNLRSVSNKHFQIPKPKINLFKNSLSYSGALVWNSIPLDIKKIYDSKFLCSKLYILVER